MTQPPTPYTAADKRLPETADELRARIPGWGADLDPRDRPAVPQERREPTGAHWDFPERQPEPWPRERSIEHGMLTPAFGTSCPPKGLSGVVRKYSYRRFGEGRAAHWLLLMAADRLDAAEATVGSFASRRPDNLLAETGVRAELSHDGLASRRGRVDARHHVLDPLIVLAPWAAAAGLAVAGARAVRRARA